MAVYVEYERLGNRFYRVEDGKPVRPVRPYWLLARYMAKLNADERYWR